MRIQIDEKLEQKLDTIKRRKYISGAGHTETINYLVNFYENIESVEKLLDAKLSSLPELIEKTLMKSLRNIVINLMAIPKTETSN